ncbi:MAG: tetraacyldisaccharide 4'-kinase [Pseudomonadota bacterium]|nr:tetraacyldisaccharide 4'-kinase [Pseudomonadota bacterium]
MRPPAFWSAPKAGVLSGLLTPLSWLWRAGGAARRARITPFRPDIPVLCVGNAVLGGAGKTPVALSLAEALIQDGHRPHFLTRGYGGSAQGPHAVDLETDTAATVGDEALLLARTAPVWVAKDRAQGARAAQAAGASHIVMDDGFQNPGVAKTVSILVVDAQSGFGNGRIFPAGPLREPAAAALDRAGIVVVMGPFDAPAPPGIDAAGKAVVRACVVAAAPPLPPGTPCLAFAGIGRPEKFFATAEAIGLKLLRRRAFPDHHPYSEEDLRRLVQDARSRGARLITTEKDAVRVPPRYADDVTALPIVLEWQGGRSLYSVLKSVCPDVV